MTAITTIAGNVTRDPELRYTNGGMAVTSFSVAVSERSKNKDTGEWEDGEPSYFDVTCFRLLAESAAETISKGQRVIVTGKLRQSRWEKDGDKRSKVEVVADDVAASVLYTSLNKGQSPRKAPVNATVTYDDEPF